MACAKKDPDQELTSDPIPTPQTPLIVTSS